MFTEHLLRASVSGGEILMPPALHEKYHALRKQNPGKEQGKDVRHSLILTEGSGQELAFGPRLEPGQE